MAKSNRRKFFYGLLSTFGLGLLGAWLFRRPILDNLFKGDFDTDLLSKAPSGPNEICIMTAKQAEGPFFFASPLRKNIKEDRNGQDLDLKLQILSHPDCLPIEGAVVEIWHCDAEGEYSGYPPETSRDAWRSFTFMVKNGKKINGEIHADPINEKQFLRGRQASDPEGWVEFNTIFPGWYVGRVPHIHAKVFLPDEKEFVTQFYFEDDLCNEIYMNQSPYSKYGKCPMPKSEDIVLSSHEKADGLVLHIPPNQSTGNRILAIAKIGVA